MILVGIGANLPAPGHSTPLETCQAALAALARAGVQIRRCSRWYRSAPVPPSDQPWFVNGVVQVLTALPPRPLLELLHRIEDAFGRVRMERNGPRVLDLDLLAHGDALSPEQEDQGEQAVSADLLLPHPRLHQRAFVLLPLAELDPAWRHPRSGETIGRMIAALDPDQVAHPIGAP